MQVVMGWSDFQIPLIPSIVNTLAVSSQILLHKSVITLEYLVSEFVLSGRKAQLLLVAAFMKVYSGYTEGTGCIPN